MLDETPPEFIDTTLLGNPPDLNVRVTFKRSVGPVELQEAAVWLITLSVELARLVRAAEEKEEEDRREAEVRQGIKALKPKRRRKLLEDEAKELPTEE